MAEQADALREKLQKFQQQFDNYKVECKHIESFLEQQNTKKQQEIRSLKEAAIKKQKTISLQKTQISQLQSQIVNLKTQIKQLQSNQSKSSQNKASLQQSQKMPNPQSQNNLQLMRMKLKLQETIKQSKQYEQKEKQYINKAKQTENRFAKQISQLQEQVRGKQASIKDMVNQIQDLKIKLLSAKDKGSKNLQITIERTKKVPILDNEKEQKNITHILQQKNAQLAAVNERVHKFMEKIKHHENRIKQLEQVIQDRQTVLQQMQKELINQKLNNNKNTNKQLSGSDHEEQQKVQQKIQKKMRHNKYQYHFYALMLTKSYYVSPFLEIQGKNSIRIYKIDKNGKVEKSLGSLKYKLDVISYDSQQIAIRTTQKIHSNVRDCKNSRIIIYGAMKSNKKQLMCNIVRKLNNELLSKVNQETQNVGVVYLDMQDDFLKLQQMSSNTINEVQNIFQYVSHLDEQFPKTPKKHQKIQSKQEQKQVRYFKFTIGKLSVQLITTNILGGDLKEQNNLNQALESIAYSKIPNFDYHINCHVQIILAINPIVGFYEQCKSTLALVNCKGKQLSNANVFDWRESPNNMAYSPISRHKISAYSAQPAAQDSAIKTKFIQQIEFYRSKLGDLQAQLKILLNTNYQNSYLKKTPAIISYQKMLRFVQSALNQNQDEPIYYSSPNPIKLQNAQLRKSP